MAASLLENGSVSNATTPETRINAKNQAESRLAKVHFFNRPHRFLALRSKQRSFLIVRSQLQLYIGQYAPVFGQQCGRSKQNLIIIGIDGQGLGFGALPLDAGQDAQKVCAVAIAHCSYITSRTVLSIF
jgi:hypothetical protein